MPFDEDQVYKQEHLRFATHEEGREPTLYFRTHHGSGRLRQQHKSGPKLQEVRMHTSHAFFPTKEKQQEFSTRFAKGMTRTEFRDLRRELGGRHTPTEGFHHFEATFDAHQGSGRAWLTHPSGGTVVGPRALETLRPNTASIYTRIKSALSRK